MTSATNRPSWIFGDPQGAVTYKKTGSFEVIVPLSNGNDESRSMGNLVADDCVLVIKQRTFVHLNKGVQ